MDKIRQPAVAGLFYPRDTEDLNNEVKQFLLCAQRSPNKQLTQSPKALIVPHAGYRYSGQIAATAYATLIPNAQQIKRVVLLGPAHRTRFQDLATTTMDFFRTPLGDIPIDKSAIDRLLERPDILPLEAAHQQEHSLEVQLPFLQGILKHFSLIPIVIGDPSANQVQQVLDLLWGGPETVIIISSDLSHYHNYNTAQAYDRSTCDAIEHAEAGYISSEQACGCIGINGLLLAAKQRNMSVQTLDLRNSGDVTGEKDTVVGYGSWAFSENPQQQSARM
ncbi:MAG: AmmeMemoRadiSam system protein B [Spongiibacteraceae bacterium]|nr:AmmeMemoRadiSam system protein B [Spongiibacteraceae bacterium]